MISLFDPVRVLQVVGKMDRAGAETLLMNLYRHINRDEVQFDFLTHRPEPGDYDDEISALGGHVFHVCPMGIANLFRYQTELQLVLEQHPEHQIVHSHIDAMSALPLAVAHQAKRPVRIAHSHNTAFPRDIKYPVRLLAKSLLSPHVTHYFACSQPAAEFLFPKQTLKKEEYTILQNAVELEQFVYNKEIRQKKREELGLLPEQLVVGHIGRFSQQKNHHFLLQIFHALLNQKPEAILLLVGQGELLDQAMFFAEQLGITASIRFLGVRSDIPALLQAMDLFLLPSLYEGFPVVGVEAQATGLPCLMSSSIRADIRLTDLVSFLPLSASPMAWADKALALMGGARTGQEQEILRAAGYDISQQAVRMQRFYKTCLL